MWWVIAAVAYILLLILGLLFLRGATARVTPPVPGLSPKWESDLQNAVSEKQTRERPALREPSVSVFNPFSCP
jgi:hypothetical protein